MEEGDRYEGKEGYVVKEGKRRKREGVGVRIEQTHLDS